MNLKYAFYFGQSAGKVDLEEIVVWLSYYLRISTDHENAYF